MRQNVSATHKVKKPKTSSALYKIQYQLEYILKKINYEKLRMSNDHDVMFCKFTI